MDFPAGFYISSVREKGKNNFGLIYVPGGMRVAAVFTTNTCCAHPVEFSRANLSNPLHKAILVNKGSANAATGSEGRRRLEKLVSILGRGLGIETKEILLASTGVIGRQVSYSDEIIEELLSKRESLEPYEFADTILTTDTCRKISEEEVAVGGKKVKIAGIAKGAGMIAPDMATMLAFICTDADIDKGLLSKALKRAVDVSFNCLTVDGDTSTNDTVFLAASGKAGNRELTSEDGDFNAFYGCLERVCVSLTEKIAADGEGATKFIRIRVYGAEDNSKAEKASRSISRSPLCKTAFYGASPNWGRIVSAIGASGITFSLDRFNLSLNGHSWIKNGEPVEENASSIRQEMKNAEYNIEIDLGSGSGEATVYTCDLSPEYVNINADYLS
ncbi:MAG: bifunctional glutamate N-acetyltransferase/amino-acid acetyltransferase ArgJ [Elusimicrobiota bacterium]